MTRTALLALALLAAAPFAPAPAQAATCQTDSGVTCPTGMPLGGYCECHARGGVQEGTAVAGGGTSRRAPRHSTPVDCGANPDAPGCAAR